KGDTTATVQERLDVIAVRLRDDQERLDNRARQVDAAQARLDSVQLASASTFDSTAIRVAEKAFRRTENAYSETVESREIRAQRFQWQREILLSYPADSTIRPADLATAANHVFPDSDDDDNSLNVNVGLPDWAIRSAEMQRVRDARNNEERMAGLIAFGRGMIRRIPAAMFGLLPVFALFLKLLYARGRIATVVRPVRVAAAKAVGSEAPSRNDVGWYYTEHLVFALHTHAFMFLVFALAAVPVIAVGWTTLTIAFVILLNVWIVAYFLVALKRVYEQGWFKTLVKASILAFLYQFVLLSIGFMLTILLAAVLG
ncbi:MAG: hypothetical protein HKN13_10420, partial [Rhodothermales bacterium]|nr:hypothetical protein [Rhodothermales bacterium]